MRTHLFSIVRAGLAIGLAADLTLAQPLPLARRTLLLHANVIDGSGAPPQRDVAIIIDAGRIISIGAPGSAADTIDLAGRWVMPGMIDAHTHIASPAAMKRALESGVTTARISVIQRCGS
jgi:imidazolonepropionase-like amidohydrolase